MLFRIKSNVPSILLAKELIKIAPPGLTRVFYSDAGATAVEIALKIAFQYWQLRGVLQKQKFAFLVEAYHGDTLAAMSVGYSEVFHHHHYYQPIHQCTDAFRQLTEVSRLGVVPILLYSVATSTTIESTLGRALQYGS